MRRASRTRQSNDILKQLARGNRGYHEHRLSIAKSVTAGTTLASENLQPFLRDKLFKLDPETWSAYAFVDKDWEQCSYFLKSENAQVEENFIGLISTYIQANIDSVRALYDLNKALSAALLSSESQHLEQFVDQIPKDGLQSLLIFRIDCALRQGSVDTIKQQLSSRFKNTWCRNRLLYPLVYYFINLTPASRLDSFLSYVVTGHEHYAEQLALKLILSNEAGHDVSLAFRSYVAMMGHPYDACELILDHIEYEVVRGRALAPHISGFLNATAECLPDSRASKLRELLTADFALGQQSPNPENITKYFNIDAKEASGYCGLGSFVGENPTDLPGDTPLPILIRMRRNIYPEPADFQRITTDAFTWGFTDGGRFVGSLLRLLFMVDRTDSLFESRDFLRLVEYFGGVTPLLVTAPSGTTAIRNVLKSRGENPSQKLNEIIEVVNSSIAKVRPTTGRLWINDFQWRLRQLERNGRISEWLQLVREEANLKPAYQTGINWQWVEQTIEAVRIEPFVGFNGAFLFLLMANETTNLDELRMKLALEPFTKNRPFADVVSLLIAEFGPVAPAFVRRFLTVSNLLALGLARNSMAAISSRVQALEACISQFQFGTLLTEDAYEAETKALTAQLLLHNVNTGKFEVPWETYRSDMVENHNDLFMTHCTMRPRGGEDAQYTAIAATPYVFPNGASETYRYRVYQSPLFSLIVSMIGDFIEHAAFGLEVILSGRFRHNNLTQEFWSALAEVNAATIPSVTGSAQDSLIHPYKTLVEEIVDGWCSEYMHSKRPAKPRGLFDVVPSQQEIDELIELSEPCDDILAIAGHVVRWLKAKLKDQIAEARPKFEQDIKNLVSDNFEKLRSRQIQAEVHRPQDVLRVHVAVLDAINRKTEELASWFDGIETVSNGPIDLRDLCLATETLFENVRPDQKLIVKIDARAKRVSFEPNVVKVAFEMLREIFYNAWKHSSGPQTLLSIRYVHQNGGALLITSRTGSDCPKHHQIAGSRYQAKNEALFREGDSGLYKVAASAATILGLDVMLHAHDRKGYFHLLVPSSKPAS
jgi:hypothetical protein